MEDSQIVELYWQREAGAISETSDKYGTYCFTIARNILHSSENSKECVNGTRLHAWNAIPPRRPNSLRMFLAKITRNLSFNRFISKNAEKHCGGEIAPAAQMYGMTGWGSEKLNLEPGIYCYLLVVNVRNPDSKAYPVVLSVEFEIK